MDLNLRIAGEAGQGVQTTGSLLIGSLAGMGLHVFATQSYLSRIRGGLNWFDVRIGDAPLFSGREKADVLVALSDEALRVLSPHVADGGVTVFDGACDGGCLGIPLGEAAKAAGGSAVMANAVAAGAVFGLLGYDLGPLAAHLALQFKKKGAETIEQNAACAREGARRVGDRAGSLKAPKPGPAPVAVTTGTEAVGLGAATSGVRLVASYPMTPSTGVFTYLASVADACGIVVEQAEDEIAAINMVCGATYAGAPAMTTTSGGGFALMAEGLSLAGMLELPAVILLSQRPGPATGLPTRTAQGDLLFALHAGHGEFARALYAPGTPEQAYRLTRRAFE
ncbi:MAG: 2-oxoacid:acceptor oxidoreductase family protein, partial [Planctomycetes bacterium]|nr:2-oxoacid:acceptor oxidoreductase family protein [Planctomycetota bacterium]